MSNALSRVQGLLVDTDNQIVDFVQMVAHGHQIFRGQRLVLCAGHLLKLRDALSFSGSEFVWHGEKRQVGG